MKTYITIASNGEDSLAVRGKTHATHPDPSLPTSSILEQRIRLGNQWTAFDCPLSDYLRQININSNDKASIIEQITVSTKSPVNHGPNLCQGRALQDHTSHKVFLRVIVCESPIDEDRRVDICQSVDIDGMKIVDAIGYTRVTSYAVIRNICLGKKVHNIAGRINDRCAYNSDRIWDICKMLDSGQD